MAKLNENRRNYKYGKLINEVLQYAPYYLRHDGKITTNGSPAMYLKWGGWKLIRIPEYPEEAELEDIYDFSYTEDDTTIYGTWNKVIA